MVEIWVSGVDHVRTTGKPHRPAETSSDRAPLDKAGSIPANVNRAAVGQLQRMAGNRAVAASLNVQRNIGFEIEVVRADRTRGLALADYPKPGWEKRDVVYDGGTWDLTLDDTPGTDPVTYDLEAWKEGSGYPYQMFNLEFVIHGGEANGRKGFPDDDIIGLSKAIEGIQDFCKGGEAALNQDVRTKKEKKHLQVWYPSGPPESANIQLTAGASLAGLNALFKGNKDEEGKVMSPLYHLVYSTESRKSLADSYIAPEVVASLVSGVRGIDDRAIAALSTMFSLIDTFLANRAAQESSNVKEATPILWKTPLNQFFESRDLGHVKDALTADWAGIVRKVLGGRPGCDGMIKLDPEGTIKIDVWTWLESLPKVDLVSEADQDYNKSFGGLGVLEGGAKTYERAWQQSGSHGHPIFEFRAQSPSLGEIKKRLDEVIKDLGGVNSRFP